MAPPPSITEQPNWPTALANSKNGTGNLHNGAQQLADGEKEAVDGQNKLHEGATTLQDGSSQLADGTGKLNSSTGQIADGTGQLKDGTGQLSTGLQNGTRQIPNLNEEQQKDVASVMSSPVDLEHSSLANGRNYGEGMGPFFMCLALWIGGLMLVQTLRPLNNRALASKAPTARIILGSWLPFGLIGIAQAVLMFAAVKFGLGFQMASSVACLPLPLLRCNDLHFVHSRRGGVLRLARQAHSPNYHDPAAHHGGRHHALRNPAARHEVDARLLPHGLRRHRYAQAQLRHQRIQPDADHDVPAAVGRRRSGAGILGNSPRPHLVPEKTNPRNHGVGP